MKSKSVPSAKITGRFLSVLLAGAMLRSLSACGQKIGWIDEAKPVTAERDQGPLAVQTANEAVALTLRQYVNARLITESFAAADFRSMSVGEIKEMTDAVALAWETVAVCAFAAQEISDQALLVLESSSGKQVSTSGRQQARFMTLAANPADASMAAVADSGGRKVDPQAWAENLTKQYDAIKGVQRYKQLAKQLGTDAKSAYDQVFLAQEIIYNKSMTDAAFWDKMTKAAQITKTTCKIGLLVTSSIATGGGSVTLLEGAGFIASGLDCVVEVADTSSTIMLGEGNKIAAAFGDIKDKIASVSSAIGLLSLNPSSLTTKTKDTAGALVYISDSFLDWFNEGKVMGVQVSQAGDGKVSVWWQWGDTTIRFDTAGATGRLIVHPLENDLIDSDIIVDFTMVRIS